MSWSLIEIETLARKAAKGGGYSWGQAEDAGRAVRWLCARGLPGADSLLALLQWRDDATEDQSRCGLTAGTGYSDAYLPLELTKDLVSPLLFLPFVAWRANAEGQSLSVKWSDGSARISESGELAHAGQAPSASGEVSVSVEGEHGEVQPEGMRAEVALDVVEGLTRFAERTYAPATEESRLAGAGAGLSDND